MSPLPIGGKAKDISVGALTPPSQQQPFDPADSTTSGEHAFVPGALFAGRYRMIMRIGRGGMGEVWHADDLLLRAPVALKLIDGADHEARERILREVRLARLITHPAVCRVYDVGESDSTVFYSMELVEGEDLATLLRRIGRLPVEKVLDIGLQLCDGLSAAHAQGVLHRDLKPANVLIDGPGLIRITDFGIAVVQGEPGFDMVVGTPGYMAPEQLKAGCSLSERTDVYALGVVLYELLVGDLPFRDDARRASPISPSAIVPEVPASLESAILQALADDPADRPASAAAMAARLQSSAATARARLRSRVVGAAFALGLVLMVAFFFFRPRGATSLTDQDTVVLADFVNTTGEPVFDGALKVALAVALEQSPFLKVFPDERVSETLQLLERPGDERVTRATAREIARREQLKALIVGSIGSFGSNYVLTLEAINAETGDVMAREQAEVANKEEVLRSLGSAASRLREELGESLGSLQRFDVSLPRATTASLDALHAYALALDEGRLNPRREAIPHLKRALELDPNFAMAQALLSGVYANTGQTALAPEYSRRAFELRDRVTERERYFISWRYYIDAAQAWDRALVLAESWTATYPREAFAFNSLGLASGARGEREPAVAAFREAIRLDPKFLPPYGNLVGSYMGLGRYDEARALLRDAAARKIESGSLRRSAYLLALIAGDRTAMAREQAAARATSAALETPIWEAREAAFSGRFAAAHQLFQSGAQAARRENLQELGAQWMMEDAEAHAIAGECEAARDETAEAIAASRDNFTLERASRTLALCRAREASLQLSDELAARFPEATLTTRLQRSVTAAALAYARGDAARTLELLESVMRYDHAPSAEAWPAYLRGQAYLALKDGPSAATQFRGIIDHRGEVPTSPLFVLAQLGAARAAVLSGRIPDARRAYESFLTLWKEADPMVSLLNQARREAAVLQ